MRVRFAINVPCLFLTAARDLGRVWASVVPASEAWGRAFEPRHAALDQGPGGESFPDPVGAFRRSRRRPTPRRSPDCAGLVCPGSRATARGPGADARHPLPSRAGVPEPIEGRRPAPASRARPEGPADRGRDWGRRATNDSACFGSGDIVNPAWHHSPKDGDGFSRDAKTGRQLHMAMLARLSRPWIDL